MAKQMYREICPSYRFYFLSTRFTPHLLRHFGPLNRLKYRVICLVSYFILLCHISCKKMTKCVHYTTNGLSVLCITYHVTCERWKTLNLSSSYRFYASYTNATYFIGTIVRLPTVLRYMQKGQWFYCKHTRISTV